MADRSKWLRDGEGDGEGGPRPPAGHPLSLREWGIVCLTGGIAVAGVGATGLFSPARPGPSPAKDVLLLLALILGVFLVAVGCVVLFAWLPSVGLRDRVASLQPAAGRTRGEIVTALGGPAVVERLGDGRTRETWVRAFYKVVIGFDGETCTAILSERMVGGFR